MDCEMIIAVETKPCTVALVSGFTEWLEDKRKTDATIVVETVRIIETMKRTVETLGPDSLGRRMQRNTYAIANQ